MTALTYVAYVVERRHFRPVFISLPSPDRDACIAACFDALPDAKEVTSCRFYNGIITGNDTRWHQRHYWQGTRPTPQPPYGEWCRDPLRACATLGRCPRDPNCGD